MEETILSSGGCKSAGADMWMMVHVLKYKPAVYATVDECKLAPSTSSGTGFRTVSELVEMAVRSCAGAGNEEEKAF